jgi:phosphatidylglycerophosphate synthase
VSVTALSTWLRLQSMLWLPCCAWLAFGQERANAAAPAWIAAGIGLSFAALLPILRAPRTAADVVTIARLLGLAVLLAAMPSTNAWLWWAGAVAVVLADLLDGAIARRFGGSEAGASLDMEADQFVVFGLAAAIVLAGGGAHALLLPAMRWAFVLAAWWLRVPAHEPKPVAGDNRRGRRICAAVLVALLLALLPGLPPVVADAATAIAVLLLAWSFSGDARHLLAHRRRPA